MTSTMARWFVVLSLAAPGALAAQSAESRAPAPTRSGKPIPADAPVYSRQGMWFGFGLGAGATSLHCQICGGDQETRGTSAYMRAGTTINGRLLLGAELNGWMRSAESGHQRELALTGNGYWYPNPRHGYYLKGGFGISRYKQWAKDDNNEEVTNGLSTNGLAANLGVGYEIRVNPKMSIAPYFNLIGTAKGSLMTESDDGTRFERNTLPNGANVIFLQLGVGLTWH